VSGHLAQQIGLAPMSLEQNIQFVEEMLSTVEASASEAAKRVEDAARRMTSLRAHQSSVRATIRQTRRALVQDDRSPSLAHIEERVKLEHDVERLRSTIRRFREAMGTLQRAHVELAKRRESAAKIREQPRSDPDQRKLQTFQDSFVSQIREYGLRSLADARLSFDARTYRPSAEGMPDLEFELSGSDLIRAIWAYYVGLLETAREHETNHPGFLIVDEPKQQGAETLAIAEMLRRASTAKGANQQVIVASSTETSEELGRAMAGTPYTEIALDGWALRRAE
jgi:hypothetical protein